MVHTTPISAFLSISANSTFAITSGTSTMWRSSQYKAMLNNNA
jgi:hypothetical protein